MGGRLGGALLDDAGVGGLMCCFVHSVSQLSGSGLAISLACVFAAALNMTTLFSSELEVWGDR